MNSKKHLKITGLIVILLFSLSIFTTSSYALQNPEGLSDSSGNSGANLLEPSVETVLGFSFNSSFESFALKTYQWLFWLAELLAVIMLAMYGIAYVWGAFGSEALINEYRGYIKDILIGGTILLLSYLILNTINPKLLTSKLSIECIAANGCKGMTGGGGNNDDLNVARDTTEANPPQRFVPPVDRGTGDLITAMRTSGIAVNGDVTNITSTTVGGLNVLNGDITGDLTDSRVTGTTLDYRGFVIGADGNQTVILAPTERLNLYYNTLPRSGITDSRSTPHGLLTFDETSGNYEYRNSPRF
ncbi:MAG: hypothetical protein HZA95_03540 [Candidatus Vogelbacteria bacterium]|nr:hypothetical protein [Candidatus Vogelbacteria bacterium]